MLRYLPALGRVLIAAIFLISGTGKLAAPQATQDYIASAGLPAPALAYSVAVLILALFTIAAALGFHANFAAPNQMNNFLKNISITGGLLQVVAFGAGAFSLDGRSARKDSELN